MHLGYHMCYVVVVGVREGVHCHHQWEGIDGVEFERTTKMKSENESENGHFSKSKGRVQFFCSFLSHPDLHS